MRHDALKTELVETMPEQLEQGVIYVSEKYGIAIHLCACGCGMRTVTPFGGPSDWTLSLKGGAVSLNPSIGNWQFACRSHYYVTGGKVEWL